MGAQASSFFNSPSLGAVRAVTGSTSSLSHTQSFVVIPILGQKKVSLSSVPELTPNDPQFAEARRAVELNLANGTPLEVPVALPLGLLARFVATIVKLQDRLKTVGQAAGGQDGSQEVDGNEEGPDAA